MTSDSRRWHARAAAHVRSLLATWRGRLIAVVVASQLLLPLHYYVLRRDPHDERFAWRMFSPMRMTTCEPRFVRDGAPIALDREFVRAWVVLAQRGRFAVIEEMAARLCAQQPGSKVVVSLACARGGQPDGMWGGHDLCASPRL
jgi:hypothetical protein